MSRAEELDAAIESIRLCIDIYDSAIRFRKLVRVNKSIRDLLDAKSIPNIIASSINGLSKCLLLVVIDSQESAEKRGCSDKTVELAKSLAGTLADIRKLYETIVPILFEKNADGDTDELGERLDQLASLLFRLEPTARALVSSMRQDAGWIGN